MVKEMPREFSIPVGRPRTPSRWRRFFAVCRMAWNCWRSNRSLPSSSPSPLKALPFPRLPRHLLVLVETTPEQRYIAVIPNENEKKHISFYQLNGKDAGLIGVQPAVTQSTFYESKEFQEHPQVI